MWKGKKCESVKMENLDLHCRRPGIDGHVARIT